MDIWISLPSVVIPEPTAVEEESRIDPLYQRIFLAFSHSVEIIEDKLLIPRASGMDGEEVAASAIRALLTDYYADFAPNVLIDCRSSAAIGGPAPTYKLAAKADLTNILPFSLGGQAGTEVVHALAFLQHMGHEMRGGAIISALQRVVPPDSRIQEDGFSFADAAATVGVSISQKAFAKSFHILGVAIVQKSQNWHDTLQTVLKSVLRKSGLTEESIKWSIAHRSCDSFLLATKEILPNARWLVRDLYPDFDFGCVDPLISLDRLFAAISHPPAGNGVVWSVGRFGAVGAVLLNS